MSDTKIKRRNVVMRRDREGQRRGRAVRSQSFSIRPVKVGNSSPEDPPEEREKPGHGAAMGNTNGTLISNVVSTKLKRIAELGSATGTIRWKDFERFAEQFPLPRPRIVHQRV